MGKLEKASDVDAIKTLQAPLQIASRTEERTILYTHEPGVAGSVQYRVPREFKLEAYVFDKTVPVEPLSRMDTQSLADALKVGIPSEFFADIEKLMSAFITAHVLQPLTPFNRDFLKRLDEIQAEMKRVGQSSNKLRRLTGQKGKRSNLSEIKRDTLNVDQYMRIMFRRCSVNGEFDLSKVEDVVQLERMRLGPVSVCSWLYVIAFCLRG